MIPMLDHKVGDRVFVKADLKTQLGEDMHVEGPATIEAFLTTQNVYRIKYEGRTCYVRPKCLVKL
jgi:hypothetical protein